MPNINPAISNYVEIKNLGSGRFIAIASESIPKDVIIEICPVQILTKREAIILEKNIPSLRSSIFIDSEVLDKEAKLMLQLADLDLEGRLDRGEITADQFNKLLHKNMDMDSLLNAKSHIFILGNGSLYKISERPNMLFSYHSKDKVCVFTAASYITKGSELTYFK